MGCLRWACGLWGSLSHVCDCVRQRKAVGTGCSWPVPTPCTPFIVARCGVQGCDTFTISPSVAKLWFKVDATIKAAKDFESAATRMGAP
eukprot:130892-Chlamydomonas_euryale.AAC.6